jgi:hypothetical protein
MIHSRTVQVGPNRYRVVLDQAAIDRIGAEGGTDLLGDTDREKLVITLSPGAAEDVVRETLLHEVLHAVFDVTGLGHEIGNKREEALIRRLSPALLDVIRRNPRLMADLMG